MLKIYNTLTRKKEVFKPINKNLVRIYVCGPTVNDVPHLGHARSQISFDVLRRYLQFLGYNVKFVSNITDIEDKIINKAKELKIPIRELTERNYNAHMKDYEALNIEKPDVQPRATQYVRQMIELIKKLEDKGFTYTIKDDGVYFDISKFKGYGKLSHQKIANLKSGARIVGSEEKRNKEDFVVWKFAKKDEPKEAIWDSPWGKGRPGWHIECSAMSYSILGLPIDIHGGGNDLIFPHHEDEIAQSEAGYGKKFANYWMHNGLVNVDKVKMSKSLGNFKTIDGLSKVYKPEVIRYFVISNHYRKPIDFSERALNNAKNSYERLKNIILEFEDNSHIKIDKKINEKYLSEFKNAMDDDLNTPRALQVLWELLRNKNAEGKSETIKKIDGVLGLNLIENEKIKVPEEISELLDEREKARLEKNWRKSDEIRKRIEKKGYIIEDTEKGPIIKLNGTR